VSPRRGRSALCIAARVACPRMSPSAPLRAGLRQRIGALLYDWPRYRRAMRSGHWELMHNRNERISTDGRGVRCEWRFTSDLHIANVFPSLGANLMRAAFEPWPVAQRDAPAKESAAPAVSFVIGHRG